MNSFREQCAKQNMTPKSADAQFDKEIKNEKFIAEPYTGA